MAEIAILCVSKILISLCVGSDKGYQCLFELAFERNS
jgi:hypothetical protein